MELEEEEEEDEEDEEEREYQEQLTDEEMLEFLDVVHQDGDDMCEVALFLAGSFGIRKAEAMRLVATWMRRRGYPDETSDDGEIEKLVKAISERYQQGSGGEPKDKHDAPAEEWWMKKRRQAEEWVRKQRLKEVKGAKEPQEPREEKKPEEEN